MLRNLNFCGLKHPGRSSNHKEKPKVSNSVQHTRWSQISLAYGNMKESKLIKWLRSKILSASKCRHWNVFKVGAPRNCGKVVMRSPLCMYTVVRFLRFKQFSSGNMDPMWYSNESSCKLTVLSVKLGAFTCEMSKCVRLIRPVKNSSGNSLIPMLSIFSFWSYRNCLNQESSITTGFSLTVKYDI